MADPVILSGIEVANAAYSSLNKRISHLKESGIIPNLGVIIVGDDPASKVYVRSKTRRFEKMGLKSETQNFPSDVDPEKVYTKIDQWNADPEIHGILVQLPLPGHFDEKDILLQINPDKDVDGFHPVNMGYLATGNPKFIPCTPKGILKIIEYYNIEIEGKHVVVLGRSNIVGRPISILTSLKNKNGNATTTVCHSRTPNIAEVSRNADILISALGVSNFVTEEFIKPGATVIDVGINRVEDDSEKGYHLTGDVDFEKVSKVAGAITPVPGGVGRMTIAMLVDNTVQSAENLIH